MTNYNVKVAKHLSSTSQSPRIFSKTFSGTRQHNSPTWEELSELRLDFPRISSQRFAFITYTISMCSNGSHLNAGFRIRKVVYGTSSNVETAAGSGNSPGVNFSFQPEHDNAETLSSVTYSCCHIMEEGTTSLRLEMRADDVDTITINRVSNNLANADWAHHATSTTTVILFSGVSSSSNGEHSFIPRDLK